MRLYKPPLWATITTLLVGIPLGIVLVSIVVAKFVASPPLTKGINAYNEGDYSKAHRYLSLGLAEAPNDFKGNLYLALTYLHRQEYPRVFRHLDRCEQQRPDDLQLREYRARCHFQIGERAVRLLDFEGAYQSFSSAIQLCEQLVQVQPDHLELHDLLGQIGSTQFRTLSDGARKALAENFGGNEVNRIMTAFLEAVYSESLQSGRNELRKFLTTNYSNFAGTATLDNLLVECRRELDRAIHHYGQTLEIDPNFTSSANYLAHLHLLSNNYEAAEAQCVYLLSCSAEDDNRARLSKARRAKDINSAHRYRFIANQIQARTADLGDEERESFLTRAAESGEEFLKGPSEVAQRRELLVDLGKTYLELEDTDRFLPIAELIYKEMGTSSTGLLYDGIASELLGKDRRAAEHLDQALLQHENNPYGHLAMARAQRKLSNHQRAVREYKKTIALSPNLFVARRELIDLYETLGSTWLFDAVSEATALLERDHQNAETRETHRRLERLALNTANLKLESVPEAREALKRSPGNHYARLRLSELLLSRGQPGPARDHAEILLEVNPDLYPARLVSGTALRAEGNLKAARTMFRRAIRRNKYRVEARLGMIRTLLAERRFKNARKEIQNVLKEIAPDSFEVQIENARFFLLLEDPDKLEDALAATTPVTEENKALVTYYRGRLALLRDRNEKAGELFREIRKQSPQSPYASFGLALVQLALGDEKLARIHLEESVERCLPEHDEIATDARRALLNSAYSNQDFAGVSEQYKSLYDGGHPVAACSAIATALSQDGKQEEAIRHLRLGLRFSPRNPDLRAYLGEALLRTGNRRRATKELMQAIKADPSLKRVYGVLAEIFMAAGKNQEAIKIQQRELQLAPGDHRIYRNLSELYFRAGSLVQARELVDRALKTDKTNPDLLALKAGILIASGDPDSAEKALHVASGSIQPSDLRRMSMLATLFLGIDRPRRVIDLLGDQGSLPDEESVPNLAAVRAVAHLELGDAETARTILSATLAQASQPRSADPNLPLLLASVYLTQGDLQGAREVGSKGFATEAEREEFKLLLDACRAIPERLPNLGADLAKALALRSEPSLRPLAATNLRTFAESFPRVALPAMLLASVQQEMGRFKDSEVTLRGQIRLTPEFLPLYFQLADVLLLQDKPSAAVAVFEEAEAVDDSNPRLFRNKGLAALEELAGQPTREGGSAKKARDRARERTSLRIAERNLRKSLELDPEQPELRLELGKILARIDHPQEAFLELRKAIRLDPTDDRAYNLLREILPRVPSGAKAAQDLAAEMIARFPQRVDGHLLMGRLKQQQGENSEARQSYLQVLDRDPFSAPALSGLATLHLQDHRVEEAISYLRATLMCDPGRWKDAKTLAEVLDERAQTLEDEKDAEAAKRDALRHYELCQYFYSDDVSVTKRLMLIYMYQGEVDRTLKIGQRAARAFPGDPGILTMVGWAQFLNGHLETADRDLRRALQRSPDDPEIHYRLGYVLEQRKIKDEAAREYQKALDLAGPETFVGRDDCELRLSSLQKTRGRRGKGRRPARANPDN